MQQAVKDRAEVFIKDFNVVPDFKAGIHAGLVTTGEIGTVKKDIVYSGDVLNTTARIVALCNNYKQDLLISGSMQKELKATQSYQFSFVDKVILRGKRIEMELWAVKEI